MFLVFQKRTQKKSKERAMSFIIILMGWLCAFNVQAKLVADDVLRRTAEKELAAKPKSQRTLSQEPSEVQKLTVEIETPNRLVPINNLEMSFLLSKHQLLGLARVGANEDFNLANLPEFPLFSVGIQWTAPVFGDWLLGYGPVFSYGETQYSLNLSSGYTYEQIKLRHMAINFKPFLEKAIVGNWLIVGVAPTVGWVQTMQSHPEGSADWSHKGWTNSIGGYLKFALYKDLLGIVNYDSQEKLQAGLGYRF